MNIIDEREVRTIHRKLKKKEYDDIITLSAGEPMHWVRLLDEGAVVYADGEIDFYIQKGTLQRYLDSLPDDYEGSINIGHMSFAMFPILIGRWTKKDLRLVDIGDGRHALDVNLRLDENSFLVKDLKNMPYDLAVSAEFSYSINEAATDEYGFLVIDNLFIFDFAIVGEPGNVNSSGIKLKGGTERVNISEMIEKLEAKDNGELISKLSALIETDIAETAEETAEETTEETSEEETAETEETAEAEETEETEVAEEEAEEETPDAFAELNTVISTLTSSIKQLSEENRALREELSLKNKQVSEWNDAFKNLAVSISGEKKETVKNESAVYTDGLGTL